MIGFRKLGLALVTLAVLTLSIPANAQTVSRGPYLQMATPTSVIVRWRTDVAATTRVDFDIDLSGSLANTVTDTNPVFDHEIELTGLTPATPYYYAIGDGDGPMTGGDVTHSFITPPIAGPAQPTRIWVIGDSGTGNSNAKNVYNAYSNYTGARGTDVWLMLGDNAYNDGQDSEYQTAVFNMYPELLRQVAVWPTLGNHDGHSANSSDESGPYYDIFTLPTNAEAGGLSSGTEAYYSFDHSNIHFVVLDSYETSLSDDGAMLTWLRDDLAASMQDWVVAFWHHPPYTKGSHDSDTETRLMNMRAIVLPILEDHGVDLVLGGHSHSYERSFLLDGHYGLSSTLNQDYLMVLDSGSGDAAGDGAYEKDPGGVPHDGAVYAVAGSSGKKSSSVGNHPAMYAKLAELGSMVIDVDGLTLNAVFLDDKGVVLDSFSIVKGDDVTPPTLISADAAGANQISLTFSENLDPTTSTAIVNYTIDNGISVDGAILSGDGRSITLDVSPSMTQGQTYTVVVNGVTDTSGNAMTGGPDDSDSFLFINRITVSFQDGVAPDANYADTVDTHIWGYTSGINYGATIDLRVDGSDSSYDVSTLIKWYLIDDVPWDATIEAASITFNVTNASSGPYGIQALRVPWDEMTATWNNATGSATWQTVGALGAADRAPEVLGILGGSVGRVTVALNADGIAAVQAWIDDPVSNHGLVISDPSVTDGLDFSSREESSSALRPKLTITYTQPVPPDVDTEAPDAPEALAVSGMTETSISLSWSAPMDNVGVTGYTVRREPDSLDIPTTATTLNDTGLTPGTSYTYFVTARDAAGNVSGPSNNVMVSTLPLTPAAVMVADLELNWNQVGKKNQQAVATVRVTDDGQPPEPIEDATVSGVWSGLVSGSASGVTLNDGTVSFGSPKTRLSNAGNFYLTVTDITAAGFEPFSGSAEGCVDTNGADCDGGGGDPEPATVTSKISNFAIVQSRKHWKAEFAVLVTDFDPPVGVAGVPLTATWYLDGAKFGTSSASTGSDGRVTLESPKTRAATGDLLLVELSADGGWVLDGDIEASGLVPLPSP